MTIEEQEAREQAARDIKTLKKIQKTFMAAVLDAAGNLEASAVYNEEHGWHDQVIGVGGRDGIGVRIEVKVIPIIRG